MATAICPVLANAAAAIMGPADSWRTPTKAGAPGWARACSKGPSLPPTNPYTCRTPSACNKRTRVWAPVVFKGMGSVLGGEACGFDDGGPAGVVGLHHAGEILLWLVHGLQPRFGQGLHKLGGLQGFAHHTVQAVHLVHGRARGQEPAQPLLHR